MTDWNHIQPQAPFNVLLIGETCDDIYKNVDVVKLSAEAPIPVVKELSEFTLKGMAANVKRNLQGLGIDPDFITNDYLITKTRYVDNRSGYHLLRIDNDGPGIAWSGRLIEDLDNYDAIVISDYNKGFVRYENIEKLISTAGCPIFIDTKKQNLARFSSENIFVKINELEYSNRTNDSQNLIVTLGQKGAWLKTPSTEMIFPTEPVDVIDVCGAGDTFLAALVAEYLFTKDIKKAIVFANRAASITVQHRGNYAPSYNEVKNARY